MVTVSEKNELETYNYYLKLCGSSDGEMMLGFTNNLMETIEKLEIPKTHIVTLKPKYLF